MKTWALIDKDGNYRKQFPSKEQAIDKLKERYGKEVCSYTVDKGFIIVEINNRFQFILIKQSELVKKAH